MTNERSAEIDRQLYSISKREHWRMGPGFDPLATIALAVLELREDTHRLLFPLDADGGPDPIGVSLEPLATTSQIADANAGLFQASALTNDGKLDISATPRGESFVASNEHEHDATPTNDFRATPARTRAPLRDELVAIIGGYGFDPNERNAKLLRDMVDRILDRLIRNSDDRRSDDFLRAVRDGDV